jgi:ACS family tartrate transporter-like MFS transporter
VLDDRADVESTALRKVGSRLIPFLWLMYVAAFLDRTSVGFAALEMHRDLGFSASVYGLGAGLFFIGYCIFEVPSNLLLHRVGGPRWLARIMLSWAVVAGAMAFISGVKGFYALRLLLGVAEAGFFPGIIFYLTRWIPAAGRGRLVAAFMTAIPVSTALGGPIASAILSLDGLLGLAGWQWLYILETLPSVILGILTWAYLPESPTVASWLSPDERSHLVGLLASEQNVLAHGQAVSMWQAFASPPVLKLCLCYFGVEIALYGVIFGCHRSSRRSTCRRRFWAGLSQVRLSARRSAWCGGRAVQTGTASDSGTC